jgi:hypothetical protein
MYTVECKCGYKSTQPREEKSAQILAEYHEALNKKRAYAHDAWPVRIQG